MSLFDLYRHLLLIVCTVYATVRLIQAVQSWRRELAGTQKHKKVARGYLLAILLSTRFRKFWPEMVRILALLVLLVAVVAAHGLVWR